jgi:hypothetical protein
MRRTTFAMYTASALILSACGSNGGPFANKPRSPEPVDLTVYINNARVSVSPSTVGAGPVVFLVTNAASRTESLTIQSPDGSKTLGSTGPINPQTTAQVTVDFDSSGDYSVATSQSGSQANQAVPASVRAATVHIGKPRPSSSNQLLQP